MSLLRLPALSRKSRLKKFCWERALSRFRFFGGFKMENEKILRKISALLNVTQENGATVEEALTAAKKAQELIAKYHFNVLENPTEKENVGEKNIAGSRKWIQILANIVCQNMSCRFIAFTENHKTFMKFIGRDSDRLAAVKTFQMLLSVCQKGIAKEKIRAKNSSGSSKGVEIAYATGFIKAVEEEMGRQCKALMLVVPSEVDEHIQKNYPCLRTVRATVTYQYRNQNDIEIAKSNGYRDGKNLVGQKKIGSDSHV